LSYKFLDHATDAFIQVEAADLKQAFEVAAKAVIDTTLDPNTVEEKEQKTISASGKDLRYLLFSWLEELIILLITDGFAVKRVELQLQDGSEYKIDAVAFGEKLDVQKHHFKVEIKAPTFYEMEIKQNDKVTMRFLMDL